MPQLILRAAMTGSVITLHHCVCGDMGYMNQRFFVCFNLYSILNIQYVAHMVTWWRLMQGVYQGNSEGPIICAVVSSPLLQILQEDGFVTFFRTAISGKEIRIVGYAFVDDTDLIQTAKEGENVDQVLNKMQKALNLWEGLIKNTGGALAVDKCRWWGIDFEWNQGTWHYKTGDELYGELSAIDTNGRRDLMKQLKVHESYEPLGVFLTADGNQKDEIE